MAATGSTDCSALINSISATVHVPGSPGYAASKTSYFAAFENEVSPLCFIQPNNAEEVAEIINHVNSRPLSDHVLLAVRSGGHTAWAGSANIEGGITIDLSKLDDIAVDATRGVASIGVGQRWGNVYSKLAEHGLAIAGGRVSKVGLGGLTLGGGLSYFSEQRGFVCDNVINYEVVLASGQIVQANEDSNSDLFTALKGGSNNFGIVTRFDFQTFKLGQMWGGAIFYDKTAYPALAQAFNDFSYNHPPDVHATIIVASSWVPGIGELSVSNLYHSTPAESAPPSLKPFVDIQPQVASTLRQDSLLGFADEQSGFSINGARQWFFTTSFRVDLQLLVDIHDLWVKAVEGIQSEPGLLVSLVFHPVTPTMVARSLEAGRNSLGMQPSDGPFVICLLNTVHANPTSDDTVSTAIVKLIQQIEDLASKRHKSTRYRFLNYGYKDQKILQGYGLENIAQMKAASQKYDPTGFFQKRVPEGFKLSQI